MSDPEDGPPGDSAGAPEDKGPAVRSELPLYREPWVRFAISFALIVSVFEAVYHGIALETQVFHRFLELLASASALLLTPFYESVGTLSTRISTNRFVVTVDYGCDGIQVCTLLTAAILAFPARWRDKLAGIVLGNLWLQMWNVVRISSLVVIGGIRSTFFEPTHVYIWPTILVALCLATWIAWARWTTPDDAPQPATV